MKVYVCGPMSGIAAHNFPAFDAAARALRRAGHEVITPSELDAPKERARYQADADGLPTAGEWASLLSRDVMVVAGSGLDAVVVLPGWRDSRGARLECFVAKLCGLDVRRYPSLRRVSNYELQRVFGTAAALGEGDLEAVLAYK
jgi:Domain of unknown function (DUF4406)